MSEALFTKEEKTMPQYPTCHWCGNQVHVGHGEGAKVFTDDTGSKYFHYDPKNGIDHAEDHRNAMLIMRQMQAEDDAEYFAGEVQ